MGKSLEILAQDLCCVDTPFGEYVLSLFQTDLVLNPTNISMNP